MLDRLGEVVWTLPTDNDDPDNGDDVPSPYWFNLMELDDDGQGTVTPRPDRPRFHLIYQNPACL